ncbi:MAG: prepilin-type N-terminal cleavage/methylation domain-containing protein [Armatimonadetes bacterium]|nr:prepilin-type N-terminal cleavage/methylation domain-containing protein [Armatimonadota bacterium]
MPNKKKGISLLEILIALTIISLAFLVISQGYASAFKIGKKSRGFTEATILGQNILEWYKNQDFDKLENLNPQQDPAIVISEHLKAWNCKISTNIIQADFETNYFINYLGL